MIVVSGILTDMVPAMAGNGGYSADLLSSVD